MRALIFCLILAILAGCTLQPSAPGRTAPPTPSRGAASEGIASYYGKQHHGQKTASGERFNQHALTAAHRTLPFDTRVRVTNLENGKSVVVRINDRGPYGRGRIIDLSHEAAEQLGMLKDGTVRVRIEPLD